MPDLVPTDSAVADIDALQARIGHRFERCELLDLALSHRSWCAEHEGRPSNERLEFLGDAVLGLIVTEEIFGRYPDRAEGELAKIRASVVSEPALATLAETLELGAHLRLGRGEAASGGRHKDSILADATEALIGAMWLDGGNEAVSRLVLEGLGPGIDKAALDPGDTDHKTRLQEHAARLSLESPRYVLRSSGPDHDKQFEAEVWIGTRLMGRGSGGSKKSASQQAARAAEHTLAGDTPTERAPDQLNPTHPNQDLGTDSVAAPERASEDTHA